MASLDLTLLADPADARLEALVEAMVLAAGADGEFSEEERAHFLSSVQSLTDGRLGGARLEELVTRAEAAVEREGREARLGSIRARLPDPGARRTALALAIQVTAADGVIRTSERELILETAEALGIDGDTAADLVAKVGA